MRFVLASLATTLLLIVGTGLAWAGLTVAYVAVDPEAYRDSSESTYLIVGGMLLAAALILMVGAIAIMLQALEYHIPRWMPVAVFGVGLLPFATLMGGIAVALNLLLLALAGLLFYLGRRSAGHGRRQGTPVE